MTGQERILPAPETDTWFISVIKKKKKILEYIYKKKA